MAGADEFGAPDAVGGETDLVVHRRLRAPFARPLLFLVAASAEFRSSAGPATHRFKDGRHRMRRQVRRLPSTRAAVGELEEARTEEVTDAFRNVTRYNPKVLAMQGSRVTSRRAKIHRARDSPDNSAYEASSGFARTRYRLSTG